MSPPDLAKHQALTCKISDDLAARSRPGALIQPISMMLAMVTSNWNHRAPLFGMQATAWVLLFGLLRLLVLYRLRHKTANRELLERTHLALMLSCSAIWGLVLGYALWRFGYGDHDVLTLLLYHAGVAAGTMTLMMHNRRMLAIALALHFVPAMLGHLLHHGPHPLTYLAAAGLYAIYCLIQGGKLNKLYYQQIESNYDLSVAAYRDCLTGLPNRLSMNRALDELEKRTSAAHEAALLYIDLDGFKKINDTYSHKIGDLFLCEAASRMRSCLRDDDLIARLGGDEFAILMPIDSASEALAVSHRILALTEDPMIVEGKLLTYSASIGVSYYSSSSASTELLLRTADEAMYRAKTSGKGRVCVALSPPAFSPAMQACVY